MQLVSGYIGTILSGFLPAQSLFTAVARDVPPAAVKKVDGQHAVIGAALAPRRGGPIAQRENLGNGQHGGGLSRISLPRQQRRPERAHDARNVRAHRLGPG